MHVPAPRHLSAESPLRVASIPGKGRGILAGRRFATGEIVDAVPVVVIPARQWPLIEPTVVSEFCFEWDETTGSHAIALGRPSLFNHSYAANVAAEKQLRRRFLVFTALRDIEPGEELTIHYHADPDSTEPVGFEVK